MDRSDTTRRGVALDFPCAPTARVPRVDHHPRSRPAAVPAGRFSAFARGLAGLLAVTALAARPAHADGTARQKLDEIRRLNETTRAWKDRTQRYAITVEDGHGAPRNMDLLLSTLRGAGGEDRSLSVFLAPAEIRGSAFLQFHHRDRDAEQWLYLSALRRPRQITASGRDESFMGTDFSFRDLELLSDVLEWNEAEAPAELLGTTQVDGQDALRILVRPAKKDIGYTGLVLTVTASDPVLRGIEFLGTDPNRPRKVLTLGDVRPEGRIPTAHAMQMVQPDAGSRTSVRISGVQYDRGLTESDFTQRSLEQAEDLAARAPPP